MKNPDCLFCKIAAKEISSAVIYEDERAFAFLDIHQRAPGHVVVIPKFHAPTIIDLPDAEVSPLFVAVKKVAALLKRAPLGPAATPGAPGTVPDGITIGMNHGRASGQEVDHLHIHLMPRWHNDGGNSIQSVVGNVPKEPLEELRRKIVGA